MAQQQKQRRRNNKQRGGGQNQQGDNKFKLQMIAIACGAAPTAGQSPAQLRELIKRQLVKLHGRYGQILSDPEIPDNLLNLEICSRMAKGDSPSAIAELMANGSLRDRGTIMSFGDDSSTSMSGVITHPTPGTDDSLIYNGQVPPPAGSSPPGLTPRYPGLPGGLNGTPVGGQGGGSGNSNWANVVKFGQDVIKIVGAIGDVIDFFS